MYQVQCRNWLHDCSCIFWLKTPVSQFSNFAPHCNSFIRAAAWLMQSWGCAKFRGFALIRNTYTWLLTDTLWVAILGWVRLFNSTIIFKLSSGIWQYLQKVVNINVNICKIQTNIEIIMQKLATVTVSSYLWGEIKLEDTAQRCLLMLEVMTAAEWACAHYAEIPIITGFVPATINSDRVQIRSPVQHLHHNNCTHLSQSSHINTIL